MKNSVQFDAIVSKVRSLNIYMYIEATTIPESL